MHSECAVYGGDYSGTCLQWAAIIGVVDKGLGGLADKQANKQYVAQSAGEVWQLAALACRVRNARFYCQIL